jgi:hypothetical protein
MEEKTNKKEWYKRWYVIVIVVIGFIWAVGSSFGGSSSNTTTQPVAQQTQTAPTVSKEQAQKDLNDFMETAKKAKLVSFYEFSDKATVVYIDSMWYTQKVDFKKDFIAKIGLLKKALTGYSHFEARDAYNNEKVAEITSFSQSIEIYK